MEENIFKQAKKEKAAAPSVLDAGKPAKAPKTASVLDAKPAKAPKAAPAPAPAPAAAPAAAPVAAPVEKSGSNGLVIAIIILVALILGGGAVGGAFLFKSLNNSNGNVASKDEPKDEPKKDEPKKDEPKKDEPKKDEPKKDEPKKDEPTDNPGIKSTDHVRGKRDSKVLVVEYADPQCPGCASLMPIMDRLYNKYGDKVAFVYRHYPISYHKNANAAAQAIEAAGKQGFFWEMLSAMFDGQNDWESISDEDKLLETFEDIFLDATDEEGDLEEFESDIKDSSIKEKISGDIADGKKDGISATPTVFVNGKSASLSEYLISSLIESALKDAE